MSNPYLRYPEVEVVQISLEEANANPAHTDLGQAGPTVSSQATLRGFVVNSLLNDYLQTYRDHAGSAYLLRWRGQRVPAGTVVGNRVIAWTQHGVVRDATGELIGDYERIRDFEGPEHENEMLVFVQPEPSEDGETS